MANACNFELTKLLYNNNIILYLEYLDFGRGGGGGGGGRGEHCIHMPCILQDQGVCIDNISSTVQQSEQNLQKCTLKCTTESLLLIRKELIKRFQNTFNSEVNLQVITIIIVWE